MNPQSRTNSHPANTTPQDHPPHPLDNVVAPTSEGDALLQMRTGLFELGRNRARLSGATQPVADDLRSLEEHARAMAKETFRNLFDPEKNAHDQMRRAEYERNLTQRDEAEKGVAHSTANLRDAEISLAKTPKAGMKPRVNAWLLAAFIIGITISVAPTLHDFIFFSIPDDVLGWFGATLSATFVASMVTIAILSGRKSTWTWIGVVAGIILGVGLGILRLSSAEDLAEVMFAVGLTIVEVSSVLLLEWLASGLRNSEDEWSRRKTVEDEAVGCRDAAQADLSRRQAGLSELNEAISRQITYVEDRFNRNVHLPELEAVAIKAVSDGYNAGITEIVGRIRGATRRAE